MVRWFNLLARHGHLHGVDVAYGGAYIEPAAEDMAVAVIVDIGEPIPETRADHFIGEVDRDRERGAYAFGTYGLPAPLVSSGSKLSRMK